MTDNNRLLGIVKQVAYKINKELAVFNKEQPHIKQHAIELVMSQVHQHLNGVDAVIHGDSLIKEILDPEEPTKPLENIQNTNIEDKSND